MTNDNYIATLDKALLDLHSDPSPVHEVVRAAYRYVLTHHTACHVHYCETGRLHIGYQDPDPALLYLTPEQADFGGEGDEEQLAELDGLPYDHFADDVATVLQNLENLRNSVT